MTRTVRLLARLALLTFSLCAGVTSSTPAAPATTATPQQLDVTAGVLPEMRVRRLHLVRPDLIFYPLAYEVIC